MKYKNTNLFYLVSLFAFIFISSSCTYDYFEDETNHVVYVPKADVNKRTEDYNVGDVKILIYNLSTLQRERFSISPFEENARARVGNFNFKLFPGEHKTYCFSETSNIQFFDQDAYNTAGFGLRPTDNTKSTGINYQMPPVLLLDLKYPKILFPGPVVIDTAYFEHKYVGRICVAMKNLTNINSSLLYDNIKKIEVLAKNVGTKQDLSKITDSIETRSGRYSVNDEILMTTKLYKNPYEGFDFGFENYYFPSLDGTADELPKDLAIELDIRFYDANNNILQTLFVPIIDRSNGNVPVILHMNETILVKVDGNDVTILRLGNPEPWDENVRPGEDQTPGGGVEM